MTSADSSPQRRTLAADPETPPDVLAQLAGDANLHVRRAAARNPSMPGEVLTLLRRAGSSADLSGFAGFDATLSGDEVEQVARLGEWGRRLAARHPAATPGVLVELAGDGTASVRGDVVRHANAPVDVLRRLATDVNDAVRAAAWQHAAMPRSWVETLEAVERGEDVEASALRELAQAGAWGRGVAARHRLTPGDLLAVLATDKDWRVRAGLAFNPVTPTALLEKLDAIDDVNVRAALAQHPNASHDLLRRLLCEDVRICVAMAKHPDPPGEVLWALALDGRSVVRDMVARHPKMPAAVVERLRRAGVDADLMHFVEPDETLEPQVIEEMARRGFGKQLAARHSATSRQTLTLLATDADPVVRMTAAKHPNLPGELLPLLVAAGSSEDLQGFVAADGELHPEQLQVLGRLGPWAKRLAARHPKLPMSLLLVLAREGDWPVRREIARHPAAPPDVLSELAKDEAVEVRWALVQRESLPAAALALLSRDPIATIRAVVAQHDGTPAEVVAALTVDTDGDVRAAAVSRRDAGAGDGSTR